MEIALSVGSIVLYGGCIVLCGGCLVLYGGCIVLDKYDEVGKDGNETEDSHLCVILRALKYF